MGKGGIFIEKILLSLLDGKEKSPALIAREFDDSDQEKNYRKYCLNLSKRGILEKRLLKRVKEEYRENLSINSRNKEYNSYKLNFENFLKFIVDKIESYVKKVINVDIKILDEDIKILSEYYQSKILKDKILPWIIKENRESKKYTGEIMPLFYTFQIFDDINRTNKYHSAIIKKMRGFYNEYIRKPLLINSGVDKVELKKYIP